MIEKQRIDKWLWHARMVRTRSAAAALAGSGHVRVNGARIAAASRGVRVNDVITLALDRSVRVLKVTGFAARRGDFSSARTLYEDLSPPAGAARPPVPAREAGSGRPTKRERRAIDRLTAGDDD
jgi:ribosome-associated heat shock protein Hsp15